MKRDTPIEDTSLVKRELRKESLHLHSERLVHQRILKLIHALRGKKERMISS